MQEVRTGEQVKDQEYTKGNLALVQSLEGKYPVRVIRGAAKTSAVALPYAPSKGYRYDGKSKRFHNPGHIQ